MATMPGVTSVPGMVPGTTMSAVVAVVVSVGGPAGRVLGVALVLSTVCSHRNDAVRLSVVRPGLAVRVLVHRLTPYVQVQRDEPYPPKVYSQDPQT
ncbi:hypothetical protein [Solihabitans fulvus]|uniref:hypothetical protein n=1 Tax=Solihabitans fulvus TaxID=1892852 RepID=UPI001CB75F98|nr:hypothetical protein [Solihabitans fulvus]